jgi:GntR family transcriptional regulator
MRAPPLPKYYSVQELLRERVLTMPEGGALPPESALCEEYGVSRITIRRALEGLARDGFVERVQGKGTFGTRPRAAYAFRERFVNEIVGFYGEMAARGIEVNTRVLGQKTVLPPAEVAEALRLAPPARVVDLHRLRLVLGRPHHLVRTYLPEQRFPGLVYADLSVGSLYGHLRATYGAVLSRARIVVEAGSVSPFDVQHLELDPSSSVLIVTSTVFDADDIPIIYGFSRLRPDDSQVEFEVVARGGGDG